MEHHPPNVLARRLPKGLEPLVPLALDLRWTWNHTTDPLWETLAPDAWANTHNPWLILQMVSQRRLEEVATDAEFLQMLAAATADRRDYLDRTGWCQASDADRSPLIAYFCLEYGLAEALPLYSGGLGMLAGDTLKTASDLGVPMVAVGLLYQQGYFRQMVDALGAQQEFYPPNTPGDLPVVPALGPDGDWLTVSLQLPGRMMSLRVWRAQVGRVPLFLLDSNHPFNSPADRGVTDKLYPGATESRFIQEIVLGIGGWVTLEALGYQPEVCHLNEGHAALVTLERARTFMQKSGLGFREALWATRAGNILTTHTPVAAAFDAFPVEMVRKYGQIYASALGVEESEIREMAAGPNGGSEDAFNMTYLAMRTCSTVNAVSKRHGEVSRALFSGLFPQRPLHEVPVQHVTNGVHVPSWDSQLSDRLWTEHCGKERWVGSLDELGAAIEGIDDAALWSLIGRQRQALVQFVRERLVQQLGQRGVDGQISRDASHVFDPNALTLGFARRFAGYKRPNLLLRDPQRLERLLRMDERPVQLIVAGKAHPRDWEGKSLIEEWVAFMQRPQLRARIVFLEDYDINIAQHLVQGVDVWINTPRRPWEACGTSGMKVLVNGGLNLSVMDGWWAEAYSPDVGWAVEVDADSVLAIDDAEAEQLYQALENEIVPLFYDRDGDGVPRQWLARVRSSMSKLTPRFSSNRMLREYLEQLYRPAGAAFARRVADRGHVARELHGWHDGMQAGWRQVRFGNLGRRREGGDWVFRVQVSLGEVRADSVAVELFAEAAAGGAPVVVPMERTAVDDGELNAWVCEARVTTDRPATDFTPRVVPCHVDAMIPMENNLIHWWRAPGDASTP